jgi:hypothetical protein
MLYSKPDVYSDNGKVYSLGRILSLNALQSQSKVLVFSQTISKCILKVEYYLF